MPAVLTEPATTASALDSRTVDALLGFGVAGTMGQGTHRYYRDNLGFIDFGYTDQMSLFRELQTGRVPLHDYGRFNLYPYILDHPLEILFQRHGAHELIAAQIVEMGLHRTPPLIPTCGVVISGVLEGRIHVQHSAACWRGAKPVEFTPEQRAACAALDRGDETAEPRCPFCSGVFPTHAARDQHAMVMHADRVSSREFQEAILAALARNNATAAIGPNSSLTPSPPEAAGKVISPIGVGDFQCAKCAKVFRYAGHLVKHVKTAHSAAG